MSGLPAVLAIDVGNSKTDVALLAADGRVLGAVRGPTGSHQQVGLAGAAAVIGSLVAGAAREAGIGEDPPFASVGAFCVAGADTARDERMLTRALGDLGFVERLVLRNDTFAAFRAGTERGWGVAVIAGSGMNGLGVGPTGRLVRFDGLGDASGDWGGGAGLGMAAHGAAVRARDRRGPRTSLERLVPAQFGLSSPGAVTRRLYDGRITEHEMAALAPVVFWASAAGDAIAAGIVDRLAAEMAAFATAAIRRLGARRLDVEVVLAGGLARSRDARLLAAVSERVRAVAPRARLVVVDAPPVVGAALLGFDELAGGHVDAAVAARLRRELTDERLAGADASGARATFPAETIDTGEDARTDGR